MVENPNLRLGLTWQGFARAWLPYEHNWIPLTWLSLLLDYALYGLEPAGYLLTNVALHAAAAALLLEALLRLSGSPGASVFAAAVFALHPLHVESVAWVSERKDVLAGVFFALCLLLYARYVERPGAGRLAGLAAALALGLLAKATLVTLPAVLLLLDAWPLRRLGSAAERRRALLEKLPLLAICAAACLWTLHVQRATGSMARLSAIPFDLRLANALDAYVAYLRQTLWPTDLAAFYPYPLAGIPLGAALADLALLAVASAAALALARARPYWLVGWLWFLGTLVPMIGLVQVGMHARADRYTYLPLIGLALAVGFAGDRARQRRVAAAAGALAVALLAAASAQQLHAWRDSTSLYRHALAATRDNFLAHYGLAGVLAGQGRIDEALHHLGEAIRIHPGWPHPHRSRGDVLLERGEWEAASRSYGAALARAPRDAAAHLGLGRARLEGGELAAAAQSFERAQALGLRSAELFAGQGEVALRRGRNDEALRRYRAALAQRPDWLEVANNLAWLLATRADPDPADAEEALRALGRALGPGTPVDAEILDTLAAAHAAAGRHAEAVDLARRAEALAREADDGELADAIRARRGLYERGRAYVEGPGETPPAGAGERSRDEHSE